MRAGGAEPLGARSEPSAHQRRIQAFPDFVTFKFRSLGEAVEYRDPSSPQQIRRPQNVETSSPERRNLVPRTSKPCPRTSKARPQNESLSPERAILIFVPGLRIEGSMLLGLLLACRFESRRHPETGFRSRLSVRTCGCQDARFVQMLPMLRLVRRAPSRRCLG